MKIKTKTNLLIISIATLAFGITSQAAMVVGVSATATTWYDALHEPSYMVDGSGLTGVGFTATHSEAENAANMWHAGEGAGINGAAPITDNQFVTFNLGGTYDLSTVSIWQMNQTANFGRGVNQFDILYSVDGGSTYLSSSLNNNLAISTGGNISAQNFSLVQTGVTHVRFEIDSAHSANVNEYVGLSEVMFDGTLVPEPSSSLLFGSMALFSLAYRRRLVR